MAQKPLITQEKLKEKLQVTNFEPNAIIRGAQLTVVGAYRALQNPALFTSDHYRQAALAVAIGIAIRVAISIPVRNIHNLQRKHWSDWVAGCGHQDLAVVLVFSDRL
ncbi:hypothetical protein HYFRA_00005809 [Hymenoscyphus fraxineus]|uniref:Uncharacterized protein n=1 Tax=Hymenoscyphus fraxineus TaxID=746836 RepID=A0A9N9KVD8_9HELO|nr:hypothetical protein HYFRA_00005809 [Hymenoscyphus fraxineus]